MIDVKTVCFRSKLHFDIFCEAGVAISIEQDAGAMLILTPPVMGKVLDRTPDIFEAGDLTFWMPNGRAAVPACYSDDLGLAFKSPSGGGIHVYVLPVEMNGWSRTKAILDTVLKGSRLAEDPQGQIEAFTQVLTSNPAMGSFVQLSAYAPSFVVGSRMRISVKNHAEVG